MKTKISLIVLSIVFILSSVQGMKRKPDESFIDKNRLQCLICGTTLANKSTLNKHLYTVHNTDSVEHDRYRCGCGRCFEKAQFLAVHQARSGHTKRTKPICKTSKSDEPPVKKQKRSKQKKSYSNLDIPLCYAYFAKKQPSVYLSDRTCYVCNVVCDSVELLANHNLGHFHMLIENIKKENEQKKQLEERKQLKSVNNKNQQDKYYCSKCNEWSDSLNMFYYHQKKNEHIVRARN